jgi:chorismate mutase
LIKIIKDLKIRKITDHADEYKNNLNNLRTKINLVDSQLLETLGKRMNIAEEIGVLKKENNVAVLQSKRWNEILEKMIAEGKKKDLSEQFILRVYKAIHQESINHQQSIFKQ